MPEGMALPAGPVTPPPGAAAALNRPPMSAPPGGTGQATAPSAMGGNEQQAKAAIGVALSALEKAVSGIQMGSKLHAAVHKAIVEISKELGESTPSGSEKIQQMAQMAAQARQQPQKDAMMRMFPNPPAGGAAPPMAA